MPAGRAEASSRPSPATGSTWLNRALSLTLLASLREVTSSLSAITSLAEELLEAGRLDDAARSFGAVEAMTERACLAVNPVSASTQRAVVAGRCGSEGLLTVLVLQAYLEGSARG